MPKFESGISDFVHIPLTIDITFPITNKGEVIEACDFCKLFTGRKCVLTEEVIYNPTHFVGYYCPLKENKERKNENG